MSLDKRSLDNLDGVHPDLVRVIKSARATSPMPFTVIEGVRTRKRQRQLVNAGKSQTMNSRHLTGHAVDIVPDIDPTAPGLQVDWQDWSTFEQLADHIKSTAERLDVPLVWGGDWSSFRDGPHYELERHHYPARGDQPRERDAERAGVATAGTAAGGVAAWVAADPSAAAGLLQAIGALDWRVGIVAVGVAGVAFLAWLAVRRWA